MSFTDYNPERHDEHDDALAAAAERQFGADDTGADDVTDDDTSAETEPRAAAGAPDDQGPEPQPPVTAPDVWTYDDGSSITKERAARLAEFEQFLQANPAVAEGIFGTVMGTHEIVAKTAAPATQEPPEELDLDDPTTKRIWDELQATRQQLGAAAEIIQRHENQFNTSTAATVDATLNRAVASYAKQYNLSDTDMTEIQNVAARLNVVPSLMAPVDPVSGQPRKVDPLAALEQAFDLARWQIPRLREQQISVFQAETRDDDKRKKKLSSLGGASGSAPRGPQRVPDNPAEKRSAMIAEVAQMLSGNWIQPEA